MFRQTLRHHQEPKTVQAASGFAYVGGCRTLSGQRPTTTRSTASHVCKARGCLYSFGLLMVAECRPKHVELHLSMEQNFDTLLHLVGFFL